MNLAPHTAYVDRAGNPPAEPVDGPLPSSDPAQLAAILGALGLEMNTAAGEWTSLGVTATAPGVRWRVVPRGETPVRRKETHYFLSDDVATAFDAAVAAGAAVALRPQRTSFGLRFTISDADGRKFVVTRRGTETAGMPHAVDVDEVPTPFDETPPDRVERRSLTIQRLGVGANFLGTILLTAAAVFLLYLTLFYHRKSPGPTVRAWSTTIPLVWTFGLIFLFVGRVALLVDPGRNVGLPLLVWVLVLDGVNFLCWLFLMGEKEAYWVVLFFYYLSSIVFTRYLVVAARDLRALKAARAAEWANSGFILALLIWMAELFVLEMFVSWRGRWSQLEEFSFEIVFLVVHALQFAALARFGRYSADRLFRTVETGPPADDPTTDPKSLS